MKAGAIGLILVMGAFLLASGALAYRVWASMEGVEMSGHGFMALALGVVLSLVVGVGLMMLVFHSHRSGHDDDVRDPLNDGS
jgi:hypothetical protein